MRTKLEPGKQKEIILQAKGDKTWKALANILKINKNYLSGDLKREKVLLSDKLYLGLCKLSGLDYRKFIINKFDDTWGRSKGGKNSIGSTIKLPKVRFNKELAEFVGAVLGDGHICSYKKNREKRKIGTYSIRIAGDIRRDNDYHKYLKRLSARLFGLKGREILIKKTNERFLDLASKELVELFSKMGILSGNKITNQSTIPKWVYKKNSFIKSCLRGLIDTDGSVFRMSKKDPNLLRISFVNHNKTLLKNTRNAFIKLGFHPSKIIQNKVFYVSRQKEIKKYIKEIGFKNLKHIKRLQNLSPVV